MSVTRRGFVLIRIYTYPSGRLSVTKFSIYWFDHHPCCSCFKYTKRRASLFLRCCKNSQASVIRTQEVLFKRWRTWGTKGERLGEVTGDIGTRENQERENDRRLFLARLRTIRSNKRLLLAKGWIAGRWLFRGSPGLNPRWRVLDVARSGQSCENGRSSIRSFIGRDFPISSPGTFRSTTLPSLPLPLFCHNLLA